MADAKPQIEELKSDWRTEITGRGRYFHFRAGSGKSRRYMRGGRIDKLPPERLEAYHRNVAHKKTKRTRRPTSNSGNRKEYAGEMGVNGKDIFGSES